MGDPSNGGRPSPAFYAPVNNEYCQTYFIERQKSLHQLSNLSRLKKVSSVNSDGNPAGERRHQRANLSRIPGVDGGTAALQLASLPAVVDIKRTSSGADIRRTSSFGNHIDLLASRRTYGATLEHPGDYHTIRFQVLVWNIGKLDVAAGSVPMTFRVTLFWNDIPDGEDFTVPDDASTYSSGSKGSSRKSYWRMDGRNKAFAQEAKDLSQRALEVPPLAILNCSTFETIGSPEVDMMCESSRLMRWSCMYRAIMIQENLRVDEFPHDDHDICIKLAILSKREKGKQWDRRLWKLALATKEDSQNSTRIPHGLIVDQARLPGFAYNKDRGLDFQLCTLEHGAFDHHDEEREKYLNVSLNVLRQSGYYDNNIVPLLALMNIVAVSVLTFKDTEFFYRALITNNIAFVQMSIRMTADSHLPSVGYQIRLQKVLNEFFFVLMGLNLQAMIVYVLVGSGVSSEITRLMDWMTAILAVFHNFFTVWRYYRSKKRAQHRLDRGLQEATRKKYFDIV